MTQILTARHTFVSRALRLSVLSTYTSTDGWRGTLEGRTVVQEKERIEEEQQQEGIDMQGQTKVLTIQYSHCAWSAGYPLETLRAASVVQLLYMASHSSCNAASLPRGQQAWAELVRVPQKLQKYQGLAQRMEE